MNREALMATYFTEAQLFLLLSHFLRVQASAKYKRLSCFSFQKPTKCISNLPLLFNNRLIHNKSEIEVHFFGFLTVHFENAL
jgi:hypothetical protein